VLTAGDVQLYDELAVFVNGMRTFGRVSFVCKFTGAREILQQGDKTEKKKIAAVFYCRCALVVLGCLLIPMSPVQVPGLSPAQE